jgi:DNA modification methylase
MANKEKKNIDYALVEGVRPPIYKAMKYWGKKPHNIWREYIKNYTPKGGVFLDPFCGSATSIFESLKLGITSIGFDLNPISPFIIEAITSDFDKDKFKDELNTIVDHVRQNDTYKKFFYTKSRHSETVSEVQNFKWENGELYELGIIANDKDAIKKKKYIANPNSNDTNLVNDFEKINIEYLHPNEAFPASPSFSANFVNCIGGNNFSNLWTKRNLFVISFIFNDILKIKDKNVKKQLLFGFIQMLHLTTKMCVPRRAKANRPFSTSWGRSAYICSSRQMEMNPLLTFISSCVGKQSVESSLNNAKDYFHKEKIRLSNVSISKKDKNKSSGFDVKYGNIDINTIDDYIKDKSIDFIMTDPPYGGLVKYLDLSYVWLSWLQLYDKKYKPNFNAEITIKKNVIDENLYKSRFTNSLKKLHKVLKDEGKIVFTFHNKDIKIWNIFLNSIKEAGFKIEKVIHQHNKRSGESVVSNPYGTSGTDFYIRCIKYNNNYQESNNSEFAHIVLQTATCLIARRNEPTPYQILFNGILAEISSKGFDINEFDKNIEAILKSHINEIFILSDNRFSTSGNRWWFVDPNEYIKYPNRTLSDRVENTVLQFLRRKQSISLDDMLGEIFIKYPNGLTPDTKSIKFYLEKYATKSAGKWLYKALVENEISNHTKILADLSGIGKKNKLDIFIGKREQGEKINTTTLATYATHLELKFLAFEKKKLDRIHMIDMIWLNNKNIEVIFEVENSTNLISAISRGTNLDKAILKVMVIPNRREDELLRQKDEMFCDQFKINNWKYLLYSDVEKLKTSKQKIGLFLKDING